MYIDIKGTNIDKEVRPVIFCMFLSFMIGDPIDSFRMFELGMYIVLIKSITTAKK